MQLFAKKYTTKRCSTVNNSIWTKKYYPVSLSTTMWYSDNWISIFSCFFFRNKKAVFAFIWNYSKMHAFEMFKCCCSLIDSLLPNMCQIIWRYSSICRSRLRSKIWSNIGFIINLRYPEKKRNRCNHLLCNFRFKSNNHIKLDNFFFFCAPSIDDKFRSSFRFEWSNSIEITPIG